MGLTDSTVRDDSPVGLCVLRGVTRVPKGEGGEEWRRGMKEARGRKEARRKKEARRRQEGGQKEARVVSTGSNGSTGSTGML